MPFNCELMIALRSKNGISRSDFAKLLGVTYSSIQKIETGVREPSLDLLRAISRYTGVPAGTFITDKGEFPSTLPETVDGPEKMKDLTKLLNDLDREKYSMRTMEKRVTDLEKHRNHILALNALQENFIVILLKQDASSVEKGKKVAALARSAIRTGEVRFDEVQAALHLSRRTLKQWLEQERGEYRCKLLGDKAVTATTPAEAGIKLKCFDCEAKASEDCRGYGDGNYPENLFMLIALLEANGIYSREKQAAYLREYFDMDITAHQLADTISKQKHGKRVSESFVNMAYTRA